MAKKKKKSKNKTSSKKKSKSRKKSKKKSKKKLKNFEMEFITMNSIEGDTVDEKIDEILDKVKDGKIIIINEALKTDEEAHLVTATMEGIREDFSGVEFCSLESKKNPLYSKFANLVERFTKVKLSRPGITFIGPAEIIREIKRGDPEAFYVSAKV
ncbi:MAG: DUF2073 domain-containing protein [Candidatus Undinarchaeales archaeon]